MPIRTEGLSWSEKYLIRVGRSGAREAGPSWRRVFANLLPQSTRINQHQPVCVGRLKQGRSGQHRRVEWVRARGHGAGDLNQFTKVVKSQFPVSQNNVTSNLTAQGIIETLAAGSEVLILQTLVLRSGGRSGFHASQFQSKVKHSSISYARGVGVGAGGEAVPEAVPLPSKLREASQCSASLVYKRWSVSARNPTLSKTNTVSYTRLLAQEMLQPVPHRGVHSWPISHYVPGKSPPYKKISNMSLSYQKDCD